MCVIEGRAIFDELLYMAASIVTEYLWSKILESSPQLSKTFAVMKHHKKISVTKHFLKNILNQILYLWRSLFSGQIKIRTSHLKFQLQLFITIEWHFIPKQISFYLLWFSPKWFVRTKRFCFHQFLALYHKINLLN